MRKISASMQKALEALPLNYTTWGPTILTSDFPKGVTIATIEALRKRGLVKVVQKGNFGHWSVVRVG